MTMWRIVMMAVVSVLAVQAWAQVGPQLPVVYETLVPAMRARIGYRGLYVTSLIRLPSGDLLACPHYGSTDLQRVAIWRSSDEGMTWEQVATRGDELFGAGALLKCLQDGTVLLHTGALYRSTDSGVTWQQIECEETGPIRSIIEQPDGSLLMFGCEGSWYAGFEAPPYTLLGSVPHWYREGSQGSVAIRSAWRLRSTDGGQTWPEREDIISDNVYISGTTDWPSLQPFFREACVLQLSASHLLAATRRSDPAEHVVLVESEDAGMTWSEPRDFLAPGEIHGHLLALSDGRLLCTYARHQLPRGIFAVLSDDQGKTWDTDHPVQLAHTLADFFGWPTSVQMPDGTILTSYTIKGYEETTQVNDSATEVVRWQLPGTEFVQMEPATEPVFGEKHNYAKYPAGITGFTGRSLQEVSYWELSPAQRVHVPGYKGALSRFPDGELLACPIQGGHSVIYRSTDEGVSWEKVEMQGEEIPGKEQAMLCLQDGKTVLLQTEASGSPLFRSADRGVTWQSIDYGEPTGTTRNFVQQSDGTVLMFGSKGKWGHKVDGPRTIAWRLRSRDGGLTWERDEVATWDSPMLFFCEVNLLPFSDTHFLAASRVSGDLTRALAGAPPIGIGAGAGGETDEGIVLMESEDAGLSWSAPRWMGLGYSVTHPHMLKLADGRILCVYRRHFVPFGLGAVLSEDNGKTWNTDRPILLDVHTTCYTGWPTSVQFADGTVLTTWASNAFHAIRWQLPPPSEGYREE